MKTFRLGMTLALGVGLLAGMTACANPTAAGSNAAASQSGPALKMVKDDKIAGMVPEDIRQKGSFTVSINPDVAPLKFVNPDGQLAGLVPDLLTAAAAVMDLKIDLQKGTFDAMIPGIEGKRFEVIGSINDFKERQGSIDFIDYLKTGTAILASADFNKDNLTPADLCGLRVGFGRGTVQQGLLEKASGDCVVAGKEKIASSAYGDGGAALLSVKSGQADAFWGDAQSMLYNAKTSPELYKVVYKDVAGPYGIGLNKDNTEFRDALRAALLSLVEDGTYNQLVEAWGQQEYAMPELPLNTGPLLGK